MMQSRSSPAATVFFSCLSAWCCLMGVMEPALANNAAAAVSTNANKEGPKDSVGTDIAVADRVEVHKAARRLYLYRGQQLLGEYKVALGLAPVGQKERERDFKTPEGRYFLARRNTRSDYFLSIQVSYPNPEDELRAHKNHWPPGGSIMIHGLPNTPHHPAAYYAANDWTDGCIALSNSDMVEVWMRTQDNIPIDIYP
jgi:murein L,D-transpeptidase YafK